jgi:hypothetical protein
MRLKLKSFSKDETGSTSLEMVVTSTLFMIIFAWMLENGFILMRWVMLEHSLSTAARDVRINGIPDTYTTNAQAHDYIKDKICAKVTIIKDCDTSLFLELTAVDPATGVPETEASCVDRTGPVDPLTDLPSVEDGVRESADIQNIMFMRACVVVDTILPTSFAMPFDFDESGGISLVSDNAYINEPS